MDRRSGLKKAHFSSVPINESFYLQKVCFSDREKFSEPYRLPKIEKTQHNDLYESRWKTQHNDLYESRWKTQHNALYESRWKTQHNSLYESCCGVGTKFYRRFCRNSDRFILRSNTCGVGDEFVETTAFY
ncbi:hypothetical protein LEP1GSC098_4291 [Leptospira interrogans serovar Grippotyphosa str. UI 08434]|nr:hypothetical protein LEP1GSC098_4291 [Leptospira interrogans serovar Grippotyphosa str. UI 08434]EMN79581.1 hypothetical protein LEP1GSC106_2745 [Leptospira interrogans serovar Grippotyphosa str. UI 12764]